MANANFQVGTCIDVTTGALCSIQLKDGTSSDINDEYQICGVKSRIIQYHKIESNVTKYCWCLYFSQQPSGISLPPRMNLWRSDTSPYTLLSNPQASYTTITVDGVSYFVLYYTYFVTYDSSNSQWKFNNSRPLRDVEFGVWWWAPYTMHDLGNKTGVSDSAILEEGLKYLLNEPASGQGTATITIKKPGQTLNFASRLLSKTVRQYISEDSIVNMNTQPVIENYSIEGLLNTETAWDSYCTYGYHIEGDSRLFCAVKVYGLFYASRRDSAYIKIYLYYKGTDTPSMKTINNTGEEYSESISYIATSDPNIFKISKNGSFMIWTNQNGSSATMNDIISNAPILEGNNLSDSERDALAINYLNGLT